MANFINNITGKITGMTANAGTIGILSIICIVICMAAIYFDRKRKHMYVGIASSLFMLFIGARLAAKAMIVYKIGGLILIGVGLISAVMAIFVNLVLPEN